MRLQRYLSAILLLVIAGNVHAALPQLGGLFGGGKATLQVTKAPTNPEVAEYKKVAVFEFAGVDGSSFANAIRNELSNARINGEKPFNLVASELIQPKTNSIPDIIRAGKKLGVDAIYYGEVETVGGQPSAAMETRTVCTKFKNKYLGICEKGYSKQQMVPCQLVSGNYQVTINVITVAKGQAIYTRQIPVAKSVKFCQGDKGSAPEASHLTSMAKAEVLQQVVSEIVPRTETIEVALKKSKKMAKPDSKLFKEALKAAKAGRWDKACGRWSSLEENYQEDVGLIYNLGLCAEHLGDLARATDLYQKADSLVIDDAAINSALQRVSGSVEVSGE